MTRAAVLAVAVAVLVAVLAGVGEGAAWRTATYTPPAVKR
jgi:hypothetical protein